MASKMMAVLAVLACALVAVSAADPMPVKVPGCQFSHKVGNDTVLEYDLSALNLAGCAWERKGVNYTYEYSVCGALDPSLTKQCPPGQEPASFIQKDGESGCVAVLSGWDVSHPPAWELVNPAKPSEGVQYTTADGTLCDVDGISHQRVVTTKFMCKPGAAMGDQVEYQSYANVTSCLSTLTIYSACACPNANCAKQVADVCPGTKRGGGGGGGLSGGWTFIIILIVVGFVYSAIGCALNYQKGAQGAELCPNYDFWTGLPGLVADGFRFVLGRPPSGSSGHYTRQ